MSGIRQRLLRACERQLARKPFAKNEFRRSLDPSPSWIDVERATHCSAAVTHRNVETLIGRLATDPLLRRRFAEDPSAILHELQEQGFELTAVELDALATTDAEALRSFAQSLDRRIRKAIT